MWGFELAPWELVLRSTLIYVAMVVVLRVFGKREVGQFTLFDLVLILLIANAVQPAMTGPDTSLFGGLVIIATLVLVNRAVAVARKRVPMVRNLLESAPRTLARDGEWIAAALEAEDLDVADCEMALREHGVADVSQVELAVLEADGTISVVPRDHTTGVRRRRPVVRVVHRL